MKETALAAFEKLGYVVDTRVGGFHSYSKVVPNGYRKAIGFSVKNRDCVLCSDVWDITSDSVYVSFDEIKAMALAVEQIENMIDREKQS